MHVESEHQATGDRTARGRLPISHIAIVVRDIDEALERYHGTLGWGPWNVYEHKQPALHDTYLHGKPTEYTMIGAETHAGVDRRRAPSAGGGAEHLQGVA